MLGVDLYAQSVLADKISASELSRKFVKSALLVGKTVEKEAWQHPLSKWGCEGTITHSLLTTNLSYPIIIIIKIKWKVMVKCLHQKSTMKS